MAKICAPNEEYNGVSAGVPFVNGKAETEDPYLLKWFKKHGYRVEDGRENTENNIGNPGKTDENETNDGNGTDDKDMFAEMDVNELKDYARENDISIGNATSREGILKKIHEAVKEKQ